jgi:hypothetical protein
MFCRGCGYNLAGLSEQRCPECGRRFNPRNSFSFDRTDRAARVRSRWWIWLCLGCAYLAAGLWPYAVYRSIMAGYNNAADMPFFNSLAIFALIALLGNAILVLVFGSNWQRAAAAAPFAIYGLVIGCMYAVG